MLSFSQVRSLLVWCGLALGLIFVLAACDSSPIVVVATAIPIDAAFHTYRHPSGVFSLRLPPDWSVRDVSQGDAVRVEFSPPGNTGLPLTIYVINTGNVLGATDLLDAINRYQNAINGNLGVYKEISRTAQGDGSWRLSGIRQTAIGARQLNTFLQADKSFLSAIEVDLTDADNARLQTLRAIINTFRVDPTVIIQASNLLPLPVANTGQNSQSGVLAFDSLYAWTNSRGVFAINGQVTNNSGTALEAVRVTALLYDGQGNVLKEQADVVQVEVLEAGSVAPFSIRFNDGKPSQTVRYELRAAARNAEYALQTYLNQDKFLIGNDKASYNADGYLTVSGDVVNKTQGAAHFIKAIVTVYDTSQRVLASDNVFLTKPDLLPGEASHFEIVFPDISTGAARYVIKLEGKSG